MSNVQGAAKTAPTPSDIAAELDIDDRIDAAEQAIAREKTALQLAKSKQVVLEKYTRDKTIRELGIELESRR